MVTADDLIPDEPLARISRGRIMAEHDSLHHRSTAARVAEVLNLATGSLNIALFGPWGSGKTSFYDLVEEELSDGRDAPIVVRFDAWSNAGDGFRANFLKVLASNVGVDESDTNDYFRSKKTVSLPSARKMWARAEVKSFVRWFLAVSAVVLVVFPAVWGAVFHHDANSWAAWFGGYGRDLSGWFQTILVPGIATLLFGLLVDVAKVTVDEAAPTEAVEFRRIFKSLIDKATPRVVFFIDELDRCAPEDVVATLEGLRTFLTDDRCAFLVAFDRDAVAQAIARESKADVPERLDKPYYATAGEYLDKIFQFQVSLPPKAPQAFRRYAASLVGERGGVWGEIRAISQDALDRIVSILAPIHLASPRRTKILLNDFAVNARIFESIGFAWLGRREEIAALTVLQTEFPGFAANMLRVPGLPSFVSSKRKPRSELAKRLTSAYLAKREEPAVRAVIDEITIERGEAPERSDKRDDRDAVTSALVANLLRYLRRLEDFKVRMPGADLILMHDDQGLMSFEDAEMYAAVMMAADATAEETLGVLNAGSESDRYKSVRYLLELVEGEPVSEKIQLLEVAGLLARGLPNLAELSTDFAAAVAFVDSPAGSEMAGLTGAAAGGIAAALVFANEPVRLRSVLDQITAGGGQVEAVQHAIAQITAETTEEVVAELVRRSVTGLRVSPEILPTVLKSQDALGGSLLKLEDVKIAVKTLSPREPKPVEPASTVAAAQLEADEANEKARTEFEAQDAMSQASAAMFLSSVSEMELSPKSATWCVTFFVEMALHKRWAEPLVRPVMDRFAGQMEGGERNALVLDAISRDEESCKLWSDMIDDTDPIRSDGKGALSAVIEMGLYETAEPQAQLDASYAAQRILQVSNTEHNVALVGAISKVVEKRSVVFDAELPERIGLVNLVTTIDPDSGSSVVAPFISRHLLGVTTEAEFLELKNSVAGLSAGAASATAALIGSAEVPTGAEAVGWAVELQFDLDELAALGSMPASDVSADRVRASTTSSRFDELVRRWIRSGANTSNVLAIEEALPIALADPDLVGLLSSRATPEVRGELWAAARESGATEAVVKASAVGGLPESRYFDDAEQFGQNPSPDARAHAFEALRLLDISHSETRAVILSAIAKCSEARREQDLKYAASLLSEAGKVASVQEKTKLKPLLQAWIEDKPNALGKKTLNQLRDDGWLTARSSWLERIFGDRR